MTEKQKHTLDFINEFVAAHGFSPSIREIAQAIGMRSLGRVHTVVEALIDHGYLRRAAHRVRSLEVVDLGRRAIQMASTAELRAELLRRGEAA